MKLKTTGEDIAPRAPLGGDLPPRSATAARVPTDDLLCQRGHVEDGRTAGGKRPPRRWSACSFGGSSVPFLARRRRDGAGGLPRVFATRRQRCATRAPISISRWLEQYDRAEDAVDARLQATFSRLPALC